MPSAPRPGPWTIKSIPLATRQAIILAARAADLTVGDWLAARVNEWVRDNGEERPATAGAAAGTRGSPPRRATVEIVITIK